MINEFPLAGAWSRHSDLFAKLSLKNASSLGEIFSYSGRDIEVQVMLLTPDHTTTHACLRPGLNVPRSSIKTRHLALIARLLLPMFTPSTIIASKFVIVERNRRLGIPHLDPIPGNLVISYVTEGLISS